MEFIILIVTEKGMKFLLKNCFATTATLLACNIAPAFAENQQVQCPNLTVADVQSIIDNGTIITEQGYTLADEAGTTRAQVLINEPTANPFDTYYRIMSKKVIANQNYLIYIGNILGKASYEAKDRATKILLRDEKVLSAKVDQLDRICVYKEIHASPAIANYPFKSTYETVFLIAVPYEQSQMFMPQMMRHKHHA